MTAPKVGCHLIIFGQAGRDDLDGTLATVKAAGYDGVEIMGSEGYLITEFTSGRTNTRTDRWGGDVHGRSRALIEAVRRQDNAVDTLDALLRQYSLDTQEGLMLMCLAEALLRVPDRATADALIRDKLAAALQPTLVEVEDDSARHAGHMGHGKQRRLAALGPLGNKRGRHAHVSPVVL